MKKYLYVIATLLLIAVGSIVGYSYAKMLGEREIERLKNEQAAALIAAQNNARQSYEKDIEKLTEDLQRVRADRADRMRELESFRNRGGDLASCRRDRERLSRLAVRGETLLKQADAYFAAFESANSR